MKIVGRCIRKFKNNSSDKQIKKELVENHNDKYINFKSSCIEIYYKKKMNDEFNIKKVKELIEEFILSIYEKQDLQYLSEYFSDVNTEWIEDKEVAIALENNIDLNTIHGVKGETHAATLYLQTKYGYSKDFSDIDNIIDFMCGIKDVKCESILAELRETLNLAYVAMSRPTHLLCIAIHIDTIKGKVHKLEEVGYEVVGCNEIINTRLFQFA